MRSFRVTFDLDGDEYHWSVSPAEDDVAAGEFIHDGGHELLQGAMLDAAQAMMKIVLRRAFDAGRHWTDHPTFSPNGLGEYPEWGLGKDGDD